MKNTLVSQLMSKEVFTLSPNDTLDRAQRLFSARSIHHIPVMEESKLVGIISSEDIERCKHGKSFFVNKDADDHNEVLLKASLVGMVMSKEVTCIRPDASSYEAYQIFMHKPFRSLPVMDGDELVGIITPIDFIKYCFESMD